MWWLQTIHQSGQESIDYASGPSNGNACFDVLMDRLSPGCQVTLFHGDRPVRVGVT